MVAAAQNTRSDRKLGYFRLALALLPVPFLFALGIVIAHAATPSPGDACSVRNATMRDASGHMMWCSPTMTGAHLLVWQYAPAP
ncbi:hypothetical protein [Mycobacterium sp. Marseille-P9652]|uniref:hypothetical protein n=1 Tax=Mycobacterium sp. Marseille-P9652 TaxID=2654950 RepID=UPI0012E8D952|nr:hypothetical protein [Mycobacterium sp. Marseille-P9652]